MRFSVSKLKEKAVINPSSFKCFAPRLAVVSCGYCCTTLPFNLEIKKDPLVGVVVQQKTLIIIE